MRTGDAATGHLDLRLFCALLRFWSKCRVGTENSLYFACFKCTPRNVNFKTRYRPCSTSSFYSIILRTSSPSLASVLSALQFTFANVRKEACPCEQSGAVNLELSISFLVIYPHQPPHLVSHYVSLSLSLFLSLQASYGYSNS